MADSWGASLIWGRLGAAVLALVAIILGYCGYTVTPEDQARAYELIAVMCTAVSGTLALVSKIRDSRRRND